MREENFNNFYSKYLDSNLMKYKIFMNFQCMVLYEDKWNYNLCTMTELKQESKETFYFKCDCQVQGYIGVGMVIIDDKGGEIIKDTIEILYPFSKEISFK